MLQKKSAFDILMNNNKPQSPTNNGKEQQSITSPRMDGGSASKSNRVSGAGVCDNQKENNIPASESKRKSNKFEDTIVLDSSAVESSPNTSLSKLSESAKKFNDFFAKREKPAQPKPKLTDLTQDSENDSKSKAHANDRNVHIRQLNGLNLRFFLYI